MATMNSPVLPPELEDRVIDHLYDDHLALSACAIVCSSWLPTTRLHLFRRITVTCSTLPNILDVLNKTPAIGAYVKCLVVDCGQPQLRLAPPCDCDHAGPALFDVLQRMSNLRQLNVQRMQLAPATLPTLKSLEELSLTRIRGNSVVDWIFRLPRLRSLSVTQVYSDDLEPDLQAFSPTTSLLSGVRLWCQPDQPFCTALARRLVAHGVGSRLRFLSLVLSRGDHPLALLESILALVRSLGPSLDRLELILLPSLAGIADASNPPHSFIKRQLWECFALSQCPNIRHLRLLGCYGDEHSFFPQTNTLDWAIDFLSNLACSGVTDLTFVLDPRVVWHVWHVENDWLEGMFAALAAKTALLAKLERVVFELCTAYTHVPTTADARRTRVREAAERIAMRWSPWRRLGQGLAFEVAESEKAPIAWGERDEDGSLVPSARTILVSADGEQPFQWCDDQ